MALDPENFGPFAGKINAADANYTYGSAVDVTAPGAGDGTPLVEGLINDTFGWQQALLDEVGSIPTGSPETAIASQYLDAWKQLILQQGTNDSPIIVDGGFNVWPVAKSFVISGENYTANNFKANSGNAGGGTATVSRQVFVIGQTDVPGNPKHYLNFDQTVSPISGRSELDHRIEFAETLSDTTMTFKFWARSASNLDIDVVLRQNFGTGGSPSSEVETAGSTIAVTTSWQKFTTTIAVPSVSGKTFGDNKNDYFSLALTIDNSEGIFSLDTTNWSIGQGEFVNQSFDKILQQCERYFEKSHPFDIDVDTPNMISKFRIAHAGTDTRLYSPYLRQQKRGTENDSIGNVYSSETGLINFVDRDGVGDISASIGNGIGVLRLSIGVPGVDGDVYRFNFSADARL